ncbi:MAG: hypothetical protein LWW93_17160 [Hyphomicrobiales bacterium]|nr:hypothetical protein [Hyphomicrobiales bacterium]
MTFESLPYRLEADDLRSAREQPGVRTLSLLAGTALAAGTAATVGGLVALIALRPSDGAIGETTVRLAVAGWIGWGVLAAIGLWFARKADAATKQTPDGPTQTLTVEEAGLRLNGRWGVSEIRWEGILRCEPRGDGLVFVCRDGALVMAPARAIPDPGWREAVAAYAAERLVDEEPA